MDAKNKNRIGMTNSNYQGCIMKIVEYNKYNDILVEFQDEHCAIVHTKFCHFENGVVKNPYYPSVCGKGYKGIKYPSRDENGNKLKEYQTWRNILIRSFDEKSKIKRKTYKDVTCCDEWLNYENFYEWIHSQENFDKWVNGCKWDVDKDILIKGNKIYSPKTCCLIPQNINLLFSKSNSLKRHLPTGITYDKKRNKYLTSCHNHKDKIQIYLGAFDTKEEAFDVYKHFKESVIRNVADIEFKNGNITKNCYDAMINYKIKMTD